MTLSLPSVVWIELLVLPSCFFVLEHGVPPTLNGLALVRTSYCDIGRANTHSKLTQNLLVWDADSVRLGIILLVI